LNRDDAACCENSTLRHRGSSRAAQSGAVDADLAVVVEAWPSLPLAIKRAALALAGSER
jgi:hypothetical protein